MNDINETFVNACENGDLVAVTNLIDLHPNINIHYDNEYAFRCACVNGHLDVVMYLMSLNRNIDIHIDNDFAFRHACMNRHLDVIKYLISCYVEYYLSYIVWDNMIEIAMMINNDDNNYSFIINNCRIINYTVV